MRLVKIFEEYRTNNSGILGTVVQILPTRRPQPCWFYLNTMYDRCSWWVGDIRDNCVLYSIGYFSSWMFVSILHRNSDSGPDSSRCFLDLRRWRLELRLDLSRETWDLTRNLTLATCNLSVKTLKIDQYLVELWRQSWYSLYFGPLYIRKPETWCRPKNSRWGAVLSSVSYSAIKSGVGFL